MPADAENIDAHISRSAVKNISTSTDDFASVFVSIEVCSTFIHSRDSMMIFKPKHVVDIFFPWLRVVFGYFNWVDFYFRVDYSGL